MQHAELWIVVPAAIGGAAGFGLAGALQHTSMARRQTRPSGRLGLVADLVEQPLWLLSLAATAVGTALQVVALATGPLAMVQPLLVTGLFFAVVFRSMFRHRAPRGSTLLGAGLCVGGLGAFLAIADPPSGTATLAITQALPLGIGLAVACSGSLGVALWRPGRVRSLAFAFAGGLLFGVSAAIAKVATGVILSRGLLAFFQSWPLYAMIILGPAGFLMTQHAYRAHRQLAPALAVITLTDPLVGILVGVLFLNEAIRSGVPAIAGEIAALIGLAVGVSLLAHYAQRGEVDDEQAAPMANPSCQSS